MALGSARHQKPGQPGRVKEGSGEAASGDGRDEARLARHEEEGSGQDLLAQVLSKANMAKAWKRVKANRGSAGADGLSIAETAVPEDRLASRARGITQRKVSAEAGAPSADSEGGRGHARTGDSNSH